MRNEFYHVCLYHTVERCVERHRASGFQNPSDVLSCAGLSYELLRWAGKSDNMLVEDSQRTRPAGAEADDESAG